MEIAMNGNRDNEEVEITDELMVIDKSIWRRIVEEDDSTIFMIEEINFKLESVFTGASKVSTHINMYQFNQFLNIWIQCHHDVMYFWFTIKKIGPFKGHQKCKDKDSPVYFVL